MTNDLLEIIGEGARWLALGGGAYLEAYATTGVVSTLLSKKIKNEKELESSLKEEISKLGLDNKKISANFGLSLGGMGDVSKFKDGSYEITLGTLGRNKSTLKHELYHIYKGDHGHKSLVRYLFLEEPRATIYEAFGIKL